MKLWGMAVEHVWWGAAMIGVVTLMMPPPLAGDSLGLRRFLTPSVDARWRIGQTFRMNADGLEGIAFGAQAVGDVGGNVILRLHDRDGKIVREAQVTAAALVQDETYEYRFAPIEDSNGRWLRLEMVSSADDPARGVALWATKGQRLEPGAGLLINGVPRWASLAFDTRAPRPSPLATLAGSRDASRPPRWLALVGVAALWLAVRQMFTITREAFGGRLLAR
jgi:hypothetical protein